MIFPPKKCKYLSILFYYHNKDYANSFFCSIIVCKVDFMISFLNDDHNCERCFKAILDLNPTQSKNEKHNKIRAKKKLDDYLKKQQLIEDGLSSTSE